MIGKRSWLSVAMILWGLGLAAASSRTLSAADPPLSYVTALKSNDLQGVVSVDISSDGRYAYTAAYQAKTIGVFSRDPQSGLLTWIEAINSPELLDGVTAARLSPDNRFVITAAFRAKASVLYSRDPKTGKLKQEDFVKLGRDQFPLDFVIDAAWSPDSAYVYVIAASDAAVNVFKVTAQPGLEFIEAEQGEDNCFTGARGIAISPDGKFLYVAADQASALTVLKRDAQTGKLDVHQVLKDGQNEAQGLSGAFSLAVSSDGRFVYLSSGRFQGNDAVSIFEKQNDGTLKVVDELFNFTNKLERFVGGNEITLSRDGKNAYAVASRSDSIVVFDRDPQTGKLKQTQFLVDKFRGVGPMLMPGGVAVSPDDRFLYIAAEGSAAVTIFQKNGPAVAEKP